MDDKHRNFRFKIDGMPRPGPPTERTVECEAGITVGGYDDAVSLEWFQGVFGEARRARIVNVPASWFQRFKARWFPLWLLRLFPVKCANLVGNIMSFKVLKDGAGEMTMEVKRNR